MFCSLNTDVILGPWRSQLLRSLGNNFVYYAPILLILSLLLSGMICSLEVAKKNFPPHLNYAVTLPG